MAGQQRTDAHPAPPRRDPWFWWKVRAHQLIRYARWAVEWPRFARQRSADPAAFPHLLFRHTSRLIRGDAADPMQQGKRHNVALAAPRLDGVVQRPGEVLSYHFLVGPVTYRRGYVDGWELDGDRLVPGVGGGLCALANMVHWLALNTGMEVVERHRHPYDLFPDQGRTVPFGVGVTVFYNYIDLQVRHRLSGPVRWHLQVVGDELIGEVWGVHPLPAPVRVYETDHRFTVEDGVRWRSNRLWRQVGDRVERIAENRFRCLY